MPPKGGEKPWAIRFFQRHRDDDPDETCPGEQFLGSCPGKVARTLTTARTLTAILQGVATAPPHRLPAVVCGRS